MTTLVDVTVYASADPGLVYLTVVRWGPSRPGGRALTALGSASVLVPIDAADLTFGLLDVRLRLDTGEPPSTWSTR